MRHTLKELCEEIRRGSSFVVACHVSPDPDAIGSAAGLQQVLAAAGKKAVFYHPAPYVGPLAAYLSDIEIVESVIKIEDSAIPIVVDTASRERAFVEDTFFARFEKNGLLLLDHHDSNPDWGTINCIDANAPATAVLVTQLAQELEVALPKAAADLLYAGLLDDTGSFQFSNTSARAFETAGLLLSCGVQPEEIANALYYSVPERIMKLRSLALATLRTHAGGKIATIAVSREMLLDCNASVDDSDGIVEFARALAGVECALFLREREEGWRVSLRAKVPHIDVNAVAKQFGGGGHRAAAGCTLLDDSFETVVGKLLAAIEEQLH